MLLLRAGDVHPHPGPTHLSRPAAPGGAVASQVIADAEASLRLAHRITPSAGPTAPTFDIVTTPNATQLHALDLIKQIRP